MTDQEGVDMNEPSRPSVPAAGLCGEVFADKLRVWCHLPSGHKGAHRAYDWETPVRAVEDVWPLTAAQWNGPGPGWVEVKPGSVPQTTTVLMLGRVGMPPQDVRWWVLEADKPEQEYTHPEWMVPAPDQLRVQAQYMLQLADEREAEDR